MNTPALPLCVDLDRTLTPIVIEPELQLAFIKSSPTAILSLLSWKIAGKARAQLPTRAAFDASLLPLNAELVEWLRAERASGRRLVLATGSNKVMADAVAEHLQLFDEVIATDTGQDLRGEGLQRALLQRFGPQGFDYAGSRATSDAVWKHARRAVVLGDRGVADHIGRDVSLERTFEVRRSGARDWIKAIRVHQWAKNALVFVPPLLAHSLLLPGVLLSAVLAFLAFGLCASSAYLLNDLFDLPADRRHPRKRRRPFAAGILSVPAGLSVSLLLLLLAAGIALSINLKFAGVLAGYYALTWAYSVRLKRVALLDVMMLAALYTLRIIAGAAATRIPLSFWLLAFSVFIFMSLGFVKRYAELDGARRVNQSGGSGRGYGPDDLPLIMSLGTASGYCAIVVMALYINSTDSQALYQHHKPLWLICPVMLFWISRVWTLTARGHMHDDPVVFALRDRMSLLILGALGLIVLGSI